MIGSSSQQFMWETDFDFRMNQTSNTYKSMVYQTQIHLLVSTNWWKFQLWWIKRPSNTTRICVTFCVPGVLTAALVYPCGGHIPERALFFPRFSVVLVVCCVTVSICFSGIWHHSSQNLPLPGSRLPKYCVFTGWGWTVFQAAVGGFVQAWWPHTSPASSPQLAGPES